ncbi:MAG: hypothetical protein ACJA01_003991, partial [Saprospiraceae bacterium]
DSPSALSLEQMKELHLNSTYTVEEK